MDRRRRLFCRRRINTSVAMMVMCRGGAADVGGRRDEAKEAAACDAAQRNSAVRGELLSEHCIMSYSTLDRSFRRQRGIGSIHLTRHKS